MKIRRYRSGVPELNTTSTADISFMLLVFFLVTTSMYDAKGLLRHLPPKDKKEEVKEITVDKEDMMTLCLDKDGVLTVNDSVVRMEDSRALMTDFILRRGKNHLFTVDASPECEYDSYFRLQQNLGEAYAEARKKINCPQRVAENYHENEN